MRGETKCTSWERLWHICSMRVLYLRVNENNERLHNSLLYRLFQYLFIIFDKNMQSYVKPKKSNVIDVDFFFIDKSSSFIQRNSNELKIFLTEVFNWNIWLPFWFGSAQNESPNFITLSPRYFQVFAIQNVVHFIF